MRSLILAFIVICIALKNHAQTPESKEADIFFVKSIYDHTLTEGQTYEWLEYLCKEIGARKSGSQAYREAVEYAVSSLSSYADTVRTIRSDDVKLWERGDSTSVYMIHGGRRHILSSIALGNSVGTSSSGLRAEVVEVKSLDEVREMGEQLKGKIVFYNRPFDNTLFSQGSAYGGAVDQRVYGATTAAEFGALAVLVRSMTGRLDDVAHTGTNSYRDEYEKVPAIAISTLAAEQLSKSLMTDPELQVEVYSDCSPAGIVSDETVIAEIRGSVSPDTIILVGGHLDSWDVGEGAHDDGAGCAHAVEAFRILQRIGYQPRYTIRCVLFANEESGLAGGRKYAQESNNKNEYHLAAIESDNGGFAPRGFTCEADNSVFRDLFAGLAEFKDILEPYGLYITNGGSGADIGPLKSQKGLLIGFRVDIHRYFDLHHTEEDTFDTIHEREIELGAASIASLVYLIDKNGL